MATKSNLTTFLHFLRWVHVLITLKSIHPSSTTLALGHRRITKSPIFQFSFSLMPRFDCCILNSTAGPGALSGHAVASRSVHRGPAAPLLQYHCSSQSATCSSFYKYRVLSLCLSLSPAGTGIDQQQWVNYYFKCWLSELTFQPRPLHLENKTHRIVHPFSAEFS